MDGFEKRRNDKKQAILRASLELFDQYGFDRVTVSEIAEKARVSKVSIYNFFESKDNIRRIVVKNMMDEAFGRKAALMEGNAGFHEKIRSFIQLQTNYYGNHSLEFFFDAVEADPLIRESFNEYNEKNKQLVIQFIDEGKQASIFSPEISHTAIEMYIDIFLFYFLHNADVRKKLEHNQQLAEELHMLFLDGLIR